MEDTIWFALIILAVIVFFGIYASVKDNRRNRRRLKAKQNNETVSLSGKKVGHTSVKCPVELCEHAKDGYCTNSQVDLCMLVKNEYDEYGLYCSGFKCRCTIDGGA